MESNLFFSFHLAPAEQSAYSLELGMEERIPPNISQIKASGITYKSDWSNNGWSPQSCFSPLNICWAVALCLLPSILSQSLLHKGLGLLAFNFISYFLFLRFHCKSHLNKTQETKSTERWHVVLQSDCSIASSAAIKEKPKLQSLCTMARSSAI